MMLLQTMGGLRVLFDPHAVSAVIEQREAGCLLVIGQARLEVRLSFDQMKAALMEYEDEDQLEGER